MACFFSASPANSPCICHWSKILAVHRWFSQQFAGKTVNVFNSFCTALGLLPALQAAAQPKYTLNRFIRYSLAGESLTCGSLSLGLVPTVMVFTASQGIKTTDTLRHRTWAMLFSLLLGKHRHITKNVTEKILFSP